MEATMADKKQKLRFTHAPQERFDLLAGELGTEATPVDLEAVVCDGSGFLDSAIS
jgi:hypothetical protein